MWNCRRKKTEIMGALKNMGNELNKISETVHELHEDKIIGDFEDLIYCTVGHQLSAEIERSVVRVKEFALNIVQNDENTLEMLSDFNKKEDYIKCLVRCTKKDNLLLTEEAWDWIEGINDIEVYKLLIGISLTTGSENVRNLKKAVFENREFFNKYIMGIEEEDNAIAELQSIVEALKETTSGLEQLGERKMEREEVIKLFDKLQEKIKDK